MLRAGRGRRLAGSLLALASGMAAVARPAQADFGLGLGVGWPSGLSLYHDLSRGNFIQGLLAFDLSGEFGGVAFAGDYCFARPGFSRDLPSLAWYYGVGGVVGTYWNYYGPEPADRHDGIGLGVRIPLGLYSRISDTPLQIGGEIAPELLLTPATFVFLNVTVYVRYLFR